MEYKSQKQLANENPGGMEKLENCHNFSSNPGFMSTSNMMRGGAPTGGPIQNTLVRGSVPQPQRPVASPSRPVAGFNGR
jgi:hypothetical protein